MPEKTVAEKLRLKPGMRAALLHVPEGLHERLAIPEGVEPVQLAPGVDFILDFATNQAEAEERLSALKPAVGAKTVAWMGYPKGSKAAGHDISRDTIWSFAETIGLVLNANIAIDETWSAVRMRLK
ncbi:MAG TPA: hypothetical protein VLA05_11470 [Coriobacteriia bacterium]|nr:hypothetical protein [Coriobacteriia bacterium]